MNKKLNMNDIGGTVVKDNETYVLKDNTDLKNLVLSSTFLKPGKQTRGHTHPGQEEVYFFISGQGAIQIDNDLYQVEAGSVMLIPDGVFHKVFNRSDAASLYFVCVFDGKRSH
jgi:mannose-6-phosphate isomerase-like protein (cupin superfamily)